MINTPAGTPTLRLDRDEFTRTATFGKFSMGGAYICESVERERDHNRASTKDRPGACIPAGLYLMRWEESPSKGWCWHVTGVPGRVGILLHPANWSRQLRGCISPGLKRAIIDDGNPDTTDDYGVTSSRSALHLLETRIRQALPPGSTVCWLFITDAVPETD